MSQRAAAPASRIALSSACMEQLATLVTTKVAIELEAKDAAVEAAVAAAVKPLVDELHSLRGEVTALRSEAANRAPSGGRGRQGAVLARSGVV